MPYLRMVCTQRIDVDIFDVKGAAMQASPNL